MVAAGGVDGEAADEPGGAEDCDVVAAGDEQDGLAREGAADSDDVVAAVGDAAAAADFVERGVGRSGERGPGVAGSLAAHRSTGVAPARAR